MTLRSAIASLAITSLAVAVGAGAAFAPRPTLADAPVRPEPPRPRPSPPPAGSDRVEVHVRFPPHRHTGTFRIVSVSGALADEGVAKDDGGFASHEGTVERVLEGAKGTIVLRVQGAPKTAGFPPIFGRWTVVRGTGAYERLAGGGTFTSCGAGEASKGSPFELQTLLGHVLHAR
jgi:hypothetical protein